MSFITKCNHCQKSDFKTRVALRKHYFQKHLVVDFDLEDIKFVNGATLELAESPKAIGIKDTVTLKGYYDWLAAMVERINSVHHPLAKSGWQKLEDNRLPKCYFQHFLTRIGPAVNSVRERRHLRQPIFQLSSRYFSYKVFDLERVRQVFHEQHLVALKEEVTFSHYEEVTSLVDEDGMEALKAARMRANVRYVRPTASKQPTSVSELEVSKGEGRRTREMEFTWQHDLYNITSCGKLSLRFFVNKSKV